MTPGVKSGARELSLEQHKGISILLIPSASATQVRRDQNLPLTHPIHNFPWRCQQSMTSGSARSLGSGKAHLSLGGRACGGGGDPSPALSAFASGDFRPERPGGRRPRGPGPCVSLRRECFAVPTAGRRVRGGRRRSGLYSVRATRFIWTKLWLLRFWDAFNGPAYGLQALLVGGVDGAEGVCLFEPEEFRLTEQCEALTGSVIPFGCGERVPPPHGT